MLIWYLSFMYLLFKFSIWEPGDSFDGILFASLYQSPITYWNHYLVSLLIRHFDIQIGNISMPFVLEATGKQRSAVVIHHDRGLLPVHFVNCWRLSLAQKVRWVYSKIPGAYQYNYCRTSEIDLWSVWIPLWCRWWCFFFQKRWSSRTAFGNWWKLKVLIKDGPHCVRWWWNMVKNHKNREWSTHVLPSICIHIFICSSIHTSQRTVWESQDGVFVSWFPPSTAEQLIEKKPAKRRSKVVPRVPA